MEVTEIAVSGYLYKWTNVLKGYKKRWFLVHNNRLSYYRDETAVGRRCRGTFNLEDAILTIPSNQRSFILTEASGRKHHLKALSAEDKKRWVHTFSEIMQIAQYNTDAESETGSEDDKTSEHSSSPPTRRRFLRNALNFRARSDSRNVVGKSPISKGEKIAPSLISDDMSYLSKPINHTSSNVNIQMKSPSFHDDDHESFLGLTRKLRRTSTTLEISNLFELINAVDKFQKQLNGHTQSVCTQLSTLEFLLSTPDASALLENIEVSSSRSNIPNYPDAKSPADMKLSAQHLKIALGDHRRYVKEFHKTCAEALQFLTTNFERWHHRMLTDQERCINLERTVEQLARQHRALEIQLNQRFAPFDETMMLGLQSRASTLRRESQDGAAFKQPNLYFESLDTPDEEQFYDAESGVIFLTRSEGIKASVTSLQSLKDVEESSGSESCSDVEPVGRHVTVVDYDTPRSDSIHKDSLVHTKPLFKLPDEKIVRVRRNQIPFSPAITMNLWSIIKNAIGKDITKLPLPVNFNEPLTFLQKAAEDMAYSHLLDEASSCADPADQLALIAAYTVSCYGTAANRLSKPFNPLWGETFEFDRSDDSYGWRLIAEQVSHHPPGSALHCESVRHGWQLWFDIVLSTKFRGKYMSVTPIGTINLKLRDGTQFTWTKASSVVHNLIVGTLWIDTAGTVLIKNHSNGYTCQMNYIAHSYFSRNSFRQVKGVVRSPNGTVFRRLNGIWDSYLECEVLSADGSSTVGDSKVLWRIDPQPLGAEKMYNFSEFALTLNEPEALVAPTDSRLRSDQRLMEDGMWDQANAEKLRLEHKQRTKRQNWEQLNANSPTPLPPLFTPIWFKNQPNSLTDGESYVYLGKYWSCKDKQDWSLCPDIF